MFEAVVIGAKIASGVGITALVNCGAKQITVGCTMGVIQKIGIAAAELVIAGMIVDKTNEYIDKQATNFEKYLEENKENRKWSSAGRIDNA